jgi:hypothetical protein
MGVMLKFGFPAILLVIGVICLLIGKKNDSKVPSLIGVISALVAVVWFVVGTF